MQEIPQRNPIMKLKPSLTNALLPLFLKNLILFTIIIFGINFITNTINTLLQTNIPTYRLGETILIILTLTILSISIKIISLRCTTYYFYETHAEKQFKLFIIKKRSAVYSRITNVTLKMNIWDRLTKAGTIILHTGDDETPDIKIKYLKKPRKIENTIYTLIHKKNHQAIMN